MNIKVAAFTVSEKSSNTLCFICLVLRAIYRFSFQNNSCELKAIFAYFRFELRLETPKRLF